MPRTKQSIDNDDDPRTVSELCKDLAIIAKKRLGERDAGTVRATIRQLNFLMEIRDEIANLKFDLAEVDTIHKVDEANDPNEKGKIELFASAAALKQVCSFLSLSAPSSSLKLLESALANLVTGAAVPAMFSPLNDFTNRPSDAPSLMAIKGALAGIMRTQQEAGMSRADAAIWIARNVSPALTAQISNKPLTARSVEEWLDRFGGEFAEDNAGRKSFRTWSRGEAVSAAKFRDITERMARSLPARKPK